MEVDNVVYVDPITNVEQLFKDIDRDLDDLEKKLLKQSGTRTETATSADMLCGVNNLTSLLLRLHQIKLDFKEVSDSVVEINAAEKEAMNFLQKSSKSILENLSYLAAEKEVNMDLEPIMNEIQEFSAEFVDKSSLQSKSNGNVEDNLNNASSKDTANHAMQNNNVGRVVGQDKVKTTGFVPIHERTFLTVSGLVRGKVKVSEVNATYEKLWRYFKEEKNTPKKSLLINCKNTLGMWANANMRQLEDSPNVYDTAGVKRKPLSSTDMDKMGLRVSGKTGQAKLKVLQSLKLLQMSSKGEVTKLT